MDDFEYDSYLLSLIIGGVTYPAIMNEFFYIPLCKNLYLNNMVSHKQQIKIAKPKSRLKVKINEFYWDFTSFLNGNGFSLTKFHLSGTTT